MARVRKIDCSRDREATQSVRQKISAGGQHPITVVHEDVAFADHGENGPGVYCIVCGDGPLGRVRSDNKYTSKE